MFLWYLIPGILIGLFAARKYNKLIVSELKRKAKIDRDEKVEVVLFTFGVFILSSLMWPMWIVFYIMYKIQDKMINKED